MKIQYVCHSCLYIDTGDTTLIIDPWVTGGAYLNQWQLYPKPLSLDMLADVQNILYSHGHEDHLHPESLQLLPRDARVLFPFQWRKGITGFFKESGYGSITEAVSFKPYRLSPTTTVTYIGFGLESIIIIEHKDTVIVNINDALNSHHENVVAFFLKEIKKRWKKIDYLFSGWSGAGYFPNTVHYKNKDDEETGRIREQYFANNFCKSIRYLQPAVAIPFAPGFVLLQKDKQWINRIKFPRKQLEEYYRQYFNSNTDTRFIIMNAGDYLDDGVCYAVSPYNDDVTEEAMKQQTDSWYGNEAESINNPGVVGDAEISPLTEKLLECLNKNRSLYDESVLIEARFSIKILNASAPCFLNVNFEQGQFSVRQTNNMTDDRKLLITTTSALLAHSLSSEWGGDALTIGYGIDVYVYDEKTLEQNLDIVCVRLLTRYPTASDALRRNPLRAAGYFLRHPLMSKLALKQKLGMRNAINKFPYNERDHWISYSKCELCRVCDLPVLSHEFGENMNSHEA